MDGVETWVVVRCSGQKTFEQCEGLKLLGIKAWTPMWVRRKRLPRTKKTIRVSVPCLPSYVFADARSIEVLTKMKEGGKLPGQIMKTGQGNIIRIANQELEALRAISQSLDDQGALIPAKPLFGSALRIISGPFQGMVGKIIGLSHTHARLAFEVDGVNKLSEVQIKYIQLESISIHR